MMGSPTGFPETLSVDDASVVIAALKERFPEVQGPKKDDICYATQNRQDAVKALADQGDVVIVVGSRTARIRGGSRKSPWRVASTAI